MLLQLKQATHPKGDLSMAGNRSDRENWFFMVMAFIALCTVIFALYKEQPSIAALLIVLVIALLKLEKHLPQLLNRPPKV